MKSAGYTALQIRRYSVVMQYSSRRALLHAVVSFRLLILRTQLFTCMSEQSILTYKHIYLHLMCLNCLILLKDSDVITICRF